MIEKEVVNSLRRAGVDYVLNLPCGKIKSLIYHLKEAFDFLTLSREEEGVGISAGLYMAGRRPLMVIQSSGFGNCVNALMSLTTCYKLPLPILISWRGVFGEKIEAQKPMGKVLPKILRAMNIEYAVFDGKNFDDIENFVAESYENNEIRVVLLRPDVWSKGSDERVSRPEVKGRIIEARGGKAKLTRHEVIKGIRDELDGKIVVASTGCISRDLYSVIDQPTNFYMLGSMGLATSIGLGLTLAGERDVIVLEGDGSILMNPSTLFTAEGKLTVLALDNAVYGTSGNQVTAAFKSDLMLLAISAGFRAVRASDVEDVKRALKDSGPKFVHILIKPGNAKVPLIPLSPEEIKERFMKAIS